MTRDEVVGVLREIGLLLELKGENPFKVRAYRNGADVVETFEGDILGLAAEEKLEGIKGIGSALRDKLHEMAVSGSLGFYEKLRGEFPEGIFELFEVPGLGPKKIKAVYDAFGVASVGDLKKVLESGEVAELSGFGKKTCEKLLEAIAFREANADRFRMDAVAGAVEDVLDYLRGHPDVSRAEVAGSWRRGKETVHDLDFIVAAKEGATVTKDFAAAPFAEGVIAAGDTKASIYLKGGVQCDLRAVSNGEFPFALNYFTGSKEHNVAMRSRALKRGYTLNEYRLASTEGGADAEGIAEEKDLYRFLEMDYVEPALRENRGEIEAAESGSLPKLLELENLRGTFHNHTTASDGKHSLEEMAKGAMMIGLDYLGIADHSKASFQANGLDEKRLMAQVEEIGKLNAEFDGFKLFAGSEVDILKDGSLDFSDEVMGELDYVVASVHNAMTMTEAAMTKRLIKAMENRQVTMLGHLTGRLLLKREPYAVDVPAVIEAAAETGTMIELNANAWRLDMDWRWWKMAKERGVKCVINPDAHSVEGLGMLAFGVKVARKGWLERGDVVNCLPLGEVETVLNAKRGGV